MDKTRAAQIEPTTDAMSYALSGLNLKSHARILNLLNIQGCLMLAQDRDYSLLRDIAEMMGGVYPSLVEGFVTRFEANLSGDKQTADGQTRQAD